MTYCLTLSLLLRNWEIIILSLISRNKKISLGYLHENNSDHNIEYWIHFPKDKLTAYNFST